MLSIDGPKINSFFSKVFLAGWFLVLFMFIFLSTHCVLHRNVISAFNYELNFCTRLFKGISISQMRQNIFIDLQAILQIKQDQFFTVSPSAEKS